MTDEYHDDSMPDTVVHPSSPPSGTELVPEAILELDHVYQALGHPRRRYLCYSLLENTAWSLTELAVKIASKENDIPEHEVTREQRDKVYVSLYHAHVPKLVNEGVIEFNEQEETITPGEHAGQVLTALSGMGASLDANQESHARSEMDEREE